MHQCTAAERHQVSKRRSRIAVAAAVIVSAVIGCAVPAGPVYEKNGRRYGAVDGLFNGQWNDYYLRGVSYAGGGYWADAAADFKEALKGRPQDQRRARTYGLHLMDYFPNRELGIACFHLHRYDEAVELLSTSLSQVETARAKFYLNKSRKMLIQEQGLDNGPPSVRIADPPDGFVTNQLSVPVSYVAADDQFVSGVTVGGRDARMELARKETAGREDIPLHDGDNSIAVQARDLSGRLSLPATVRVRVDREGPLLFMDGEPDSRGGVAVSGTAIDASDIVKATLCGRPLALVRGRIVTIEEYIPAERIRGSVSLAFAAEDSAGNITRGSIRLSPSGTPATGCSSLEASAGNDAVMSDAPGYLPARPGVSFALAAAADGQRGPGPSVDLKGLQEGQTVFFDALFVEGRVTAPRGVKSIAVNGRQLFASPDEASLGSLLREMTGRRKTSFVFSRLVSLAEGVNTVVVSLTDGAGETVTRKLTVIRRVSAVRKIGSRLAVAVCPFKQPPSAAAQLSDYVQTFLTAALVNQQRFYVLERAELERILAEQQLSQEDIFNQDTAVRLGRMMAAETVLAGDIFATDHSVEIAARMIDAETSLILAEKDVYWEGSPAEGFREILEGLAHKFREHFPLCEGKIIRVTGEGALVNIGSESGLARGMRMVAFREDDLLIDPDTGQNLGADTEVLGVLAVRDVYPKYARTAYVKNSTPGGLEPKTLVMTK